MTNPLITPLIKLDHISKLFGPRPVLENISMQLMRGEITTLIGPNGAGKSTLVRIILGLLKPDSGSVWPADELKIGYMPQKINIFEIKQRSPANYASYLNIMI
mgnify:CR=1 FL=1